MNLHLHLVNMTTDIEDEIIDKLSHLSLDDLNDSFDIFTNIGTTGCPTELNSDQILKNEPSSAIIPTKGTRKYFDRYDKIKSKYIKGKDKYNPCIPKQEPIYRGGTKLNINCSDNRKEELYLWEEIWNYSS